MGTCTVNVTYTPTSLDSVGATLTVTDTQGAFTVKDILGLGGYGIPQLAFSNILEAVGAPNQICGTNNTNLVNNLTTEVNNISLSTSDAGMQITSTSCNGSLAGGAQCSITVNICLNGAQYSSCSYLIANDSAADSPQSDQGCFYAWRP